nr:unnamed protein product [Callosobruchus chinensis]
MFDTFYNKPNHRSTR